MSRIILFGAGQRTEKFFSELRKDVSVDMIVDNDCQKWGRVICGVKVFSPDNILLRECDYVVIVPYDYFSIQEQLLEMGICRERIVNCTCYERVCVGKPINLYGNKVNKCEKSIVAFSHALSSTGAQNVLMSTLMEYMKLGYSITVISTSDGELRDDFVHAGASVYVIPDLYAHKELIEKLVSDASIVWINTLWLYFIIFDFRLECNKIVWWIHESLDIETIDRRVFEICEKNDIHVLAVSEIVRDSVHAVAPSNLKVDILRFELPRYSICHNNNEKINVVVLAAMAYIKGQDVFMEAVNRIPETIRGKASFYVVGGGARTDELVQRAYESGVSIVEAIPRRKVYQIYETMDVLVCPSRKEAMSVSAVEAMMHGILTVVSDASGIARYIENGKNGFVFESENYDELSSILQDVITNDEKRIAIGKMGRGIYDTYFSDDVHRKNLMSI